MEAQRNLIKDMQGQAHVLKSEAISCQSTVIKLQEEVISVKDNQIVDFHSSVKTSVETAVVKSFSEAVQAVQPQCGAPDVGSPPVMNKDTLKSVVKDVVDEEDRGRNVVMFGISEDGGQSLDDKINLVLADIDEKPRFKAVRLGTKKRISSDATGESIFQQQYNSAANFEEIEEFEQVYESQNCICST